MKKNKLNIPFFCICLFCLLSFSLSVSASSLDIAFCYVSDEAGLLDNNITQELNSAAESISQEYQCGIYLVTVDNFLNYTNKSDIFSFSEDLFEDYELGLGSDRDGVLLVLSMEDRDYALIAHGDFGNAAFTDYGKDVMTEAFLEPLGNNDWEDGFRIYLDYCDSLLEMASNGEPLDIASVYYEEELTASENFISSLLIAIFFSSIIAGIVCIVFLIQMKSVKKQISAQAYIAANGVNLRIRQDQFTHVTETRTKIQSSSNNSSGGGTTVNSSGFSGKSGKF